MSTRRRLDAELVRRGLAPSRTRAQQDIADGRVLVGGAPAAKPTRLVSAGEAIVVQGPGPRWVSRAGAKLDGALDRFGVDVREWRVVDAGASTGGFSDCLLQRGAAEIVAVDVGYGQLHERVAGDDRVRVVDRTNVRDLDPAIVGDPVDLVTADLSFISLRLVLDALFAVLRPGGSMVALVKPQFEAGRQVVARGRGIVTEPEVWRSVLDEVTSACEARGATIMGVMASPITGTDGNVEFLLHAVRPGDGAGPDRHELIERALAEAGAPGGGTMTTFGLVLHQERTQAIDLAIDAVNRLEAQGHKVRLPAIDAHDIALVDHGVADEDFAPGLDVAVSLGGDGCMLRAVHLVAAEGVPVLGVNLGQLGYLTEIEPAGLWESLDRFVSGDFAIEERMLLQVTVVGRDQQLLALNEAVLEKTPSGHTVRLDVQIDGREFTPYAADGLIVATATGSTAYNLSARGPIVAPTHRAMVLTPVSPHMLFDRSLVLEPDTVLRLTVSGHRAAALAVDGRMIDELEPGDAIECTASSHRARLVVFGPRDFHRILKAKFRLSDR